MFFKNSLIFSLFLILILRSQKKVSVAYPSRHFRNVDDNSSVTTRVINLTNPEHEGLLRQFNISVEQLKHIRSTVVAASTTPEPDENDKLRDIKEMRFQELKYKIENAIHGNSMSYENYPVHEMAAYPTCGQLNESAWQQENNITIRFAASLFEYNHPDMYLDTAVLRLFKLDPESNFRTLPMTSTNCDDTPVESQIRVTVSTVQYARRNKKEKKKRICNTVMLNMSQTGWIEIDIKKAINLWEKAERQSRNANFNSNNNSNNDNNSNINNNNNNYINNINKPVVGWLTIEVHDEEEKPLKAGLYFEPPKCSEAYPAIPWNFYRQYTFGPSADMEEVPRSPRLDIKIIDRRSVIPYRHIGSRNPYYNHRTVYHHTPTTNRGIDSDLIPSSEIADLSISSTSSQEELSSSSATRTHKKRHDQQIISDSNGNNDQHEEGKYQHHEEKQQNEQQQRHHHHHHHHNNNNHHHHEQHHHSQPQHSDRGLVPVDRDSNLKN